MSVHPTVARLIALEPRGITLYAPWAWAVADLDKRIENRVWAPPAKLRGSVIAIHAGARDCDKELGPHYLYRNADALAGVTYMAMRAGWQASFDPVRQIVRASKDGWAMELDPRKGAPETFARRAIVGFARLDSWARNPADDDIDGWRALPEVARRSRGWAVPGEVGFHLHGFVRLSAPLPVERGEMGFWRVEPETLRLLDDTALPTELGAIARLIAGAPEPAPTWRERLAEERANRARLRMREDWSGYAIRHPSKPQGPCFFCGRPIRPHTREFYVTAPDRWRKAHAACAPGLGVPVGAPYATP